MFVYFFTLICSFFSLYVFPQLDKSSKYRVYLYIFSNVSFFLFIHTDICFCIALYAVYYYTQNEALVRVYALENTHIEKRIGYTFILLFFINFFFTLNFFFFFFLFLRSVFFCFSLVSSFSCILFYYTYIGCALM